MHFELLEVHRAPADLVSARVGDITFTGAVIDWRSLTRPDRAFVLDQIDDAARAWVGELDGVVGLRITDESGSPHLELRAEDGPWRAAPALKTLPRAAQDEIDAALDAALESVHALLIIT